MYVRVHMCVCAACVRACVRTCVCACVCVYVCGCVGGVGVCALLQLNSVRHLTHTCKCLIM